MRLQHPSRGSRAHFRAYARVCKDASSKKIVRENRVWALGVCRGAISEINELWDDYYSVLRTGTAWKFNR